jgi:hypothetical protein
MYAAYEKDQIATYVGAAWGYSLLRDNLPDQAGKWTVVPLPTWGSSVASGDWGGSTVAFMKGSAHLYESVKFNLWLNTDPAALTLENRLGGLYPAATARTRARHPVLRRPEDLRRLRRLVPARRHRLHLGAHPEDGEPGAAGRDGQGRGGQQHAHRRALGRPIDRADVDEGSGDPRRGRVISA